MSDVTDVSVETLVEHWETQARKITEAGVPYDRVAHSMMLAALNVETASFDLHLQKAKSRMVEGINHPMGPNHVAWAAGPRIQVNKTRWRHVEHHLWLSARPPRTRSGCAELSVAPPACNSGDSGRPSIAF